MSCYEWEHGTIKIPARQWKDFAEKILSASSRRLNESGEISISLTGDASIVLNAATKSVSWVVYENNRACEEARDHELAKVLFRALGNINWVRGSGGKIVGNDEYNRDSCVLGACGNYLVASYGPNKKHRGFK